MSIKATTRQVNGVTVVDINGRITLGEGSSTLRETVRDLFNSGERKILLNLSDVSYIDSSETGELVSCFATVTNQGGQLKLLHLTKRCMNSCRSLSCIRCLKFTTTKLRGFTAFLKPPASPCFRNDAWDLSSAGV